MILKLIKFIIPNFLLNYIRPYWNRLRIICVFYKNGGSVTYDKEIEEKVFKKKFNDKTVSIVCRSFREFRRWHNFGIDKNDILFKWLNELKGCNVFLDIGSANGLEGFYSMFKHNCEVIMIEPSAWSIETILKTTYHNKKRDKIKKKISIIQAICDKKSGFKELVTHTIPKPGTTENSSLIDLSKYQGDRKVTNISTSQWIKVISIDDIFYKYKFKKPDYMKIDVDGFECNVIDGAKRLLGSKYLKGMVIEVNDNNGPYILRKMKKYGYEKEFEFQHLKPSKTSFTADYVFKKK